VLADHVGVATQRRAQPFDGRQLRIRLDPRPEGGDQRLEAGEIEALLAAEVLEDQTVRDIRGIGNLVDRDLVVVAVAEDLERGREQFEASLSRPLACERSRGDRSRIAAVDFASTPNNGWPRIRDRW